MKLLAIDTATEACSVALYIDGDIAQDFRVAPRQHSHLILPMIEGLLQQAGLTVSALDVLAFGRGPGSFMGVRIAAGVVQGIAYAHKLPVVPVSTLAAIAQVAERTTGAPKVLAAIDARMNEVYWGAYTLDTSGLMRLHGDEIVIPPSRLDKPEGAGWIGAGTGWGSYAAELDAVTGDSVIECLDNLLPDAQAIAELAAADFLAGRFVTAAAAVPVYLRDNVAKKAAGTV
jgi:tRNA threonylcarbamoyladenosine biosynthesis protein TsaB